MAQIKFTQIVYQVIKYAPTQLLHATYAKVKKFYGLRVDDYGRIYARATTYSTKLYDKKRRVWYRKITPKVYDTFIMINPKRKNVVLSCSCPDFLYRHEVALYRRGGAEIEYSNGRLPKITNPRYRPTCCKHCLAFYLYLSNRRPDIFEPDLDLVNAIG